MMNRGGSDDDVDISSALDVVPSAPILDDEYDQLQSHNQPNQQQQSNPDRQSTSDSQMSMPSFMDLSMDSTILPPPIMPPSPEEGPRAKEEETDPGNQEGIDNFAISNRESLSLAAGNAQQSLDSEIDHELQCVQTYKNGSGQELVTLQSPEWLQPRRERFDGTEFAIDNRSRTPHQHVHRPPRDELLTQEDAFARTDDVDDSKNENDDDYENSEESDRFQYLPSHHIPMTTSNMPVSNCMNRSNPVETPPARTFTSPNETDIVIHQTLSDVSSLGAGSFTPDRKLASTDTPSNYNSKKIQNITPVRNTRSPSVATLNTHSTRSSRRSRASTSHRSSTTMSLQHNEVINLEGHYPVQRYRNQQAMLHHQHLYHHSSVRDGDEDYDDVHDEFAALSPDPSFSTQMSSSRRFHVSDSYPIVTDEESGMDVEGMEIGSVSRDFYSSKGHPQNGPVISWGVAAEYWSLAQHKARQFSVSVRHGIIILQDKTVDMTRRVLHFYRPPLSPRSRELKDLQFLQQSHKEKVGQWKPNIVGSDGRRHSASPSGFLEESNEDKFCDFLIILTPQEVYRYWADLLDFREEHLGMDSVNMLWGQRLETSDAVSTNTTESHTTEEDDDNQCEDGKSVCRNPVEKSTNNGDRNQTEAYVPDLPSQSTCHQEEFLTPLTGLLRRRGSRTPDQSENAVGINASLTRSISRRRMSNLANQCLNQVDQSQPPVFQTPATVSWRNRNMSMFERAVNSPLLTGSETANRSRAVSYDHSIGMSTYSAGNGTVGTPTVTGNPEQRGSISTIRRRWGNHAMTNQSGATKGNALSPPIRSLTRGEGAVGKQPLSSLQANLSSSVRVKNNYNVNTTNNDQDPNTSIENQENQDPHCIRSEYDIPNPVIPRGIAVRTNGLLQFLSALKRGIVLRRHRANKEAIYCKISSNDGGDTIQYQMIDPEEAMVAFKEQRVRYNRNLTHSSSPTTVRAFSRDWSCMDGPYDGSPLHKFQVPDHVAAQKYREKLQQQHGVAKRLFEVASKAANSGLVRASDVVAVHPASHPDPRHPGVRNGELGTASLRRSLSEAYTPFSFSLVTVVGQRSKKSGPSYAVDGKFEEKWFDGELSELQFKTLDFEAATEGEYWLVFRGFLLLHRDAAIGRYAAERSAGIGCRRTESPTHADDSEAGERERNVERRLQRDTFVEPITVGWLEKIWVHFRKLDDSYFRGVVMPGAAPPPSDYFLGFKSPGTQIWSRLRLAGLETQRIYAVDTTRVMIKVRCPEDRLTDVAEVLRLKMKTLDGAFAPFREDMAHIFQPRSDWLDIPFMYRGTTASLLKSKDRQQIIDFIIGSRIRDSGAELGQNSDVGKMIQARVPLHMPQKLDSLCKSWVFFWRRSRWIDDEPKSHKVDGPTAPLEEGLSSTSGNHQKHSKKTDSVSPSPTSCVDDRPIPNFITRFFVEAFKQPLDAIEEYFGEQVTFYFAWLQHCATHLLVLSVFGLFMSICQISTDNFDHPLRPLFAMVVMLWTFVVLINWRKRSNYLAHRWGSMEYKEQETTRPEFHGEYVIDPITNEWEIKYPKWKRWLKYLISVPISLGFTALALALILLVHTNRDHQISQYFARRDTTVGTSSEKYNLDEFEVSWKNVGQEAIVVDSTISSDVLLDPTYWFLMGAMPAMLGLCIPILNLILTKISIMLNNFENYRTESEYRTHLIIKVFSFRIVSQLGTVYYYAFKSTGTREAVENGFIKMGTSVMVYTTVAHWWNIILQVYFFMLVRNIRRRIYRQKLMTELKNIELLEEEHVANHRSDAEARELRLINKRMLLDQAQDDLWFEIMNPPHDSFPEYITAVVQFTFVACFSVILPITPFLVLVNYLLNMRFDAYKLCRGRRRPLAKRTGGIGVWEHLLHVVSVLGVLTNCWLIATTNSNFAKLAEQVGETATFVIIVAWEHIMLLIKYTMTATISPLPKEVRDEMKRKQHEIDQERYADMRLKKERSRRSKIQKSASFADSSSEARSRIPKESVRNKTDFGQSEAPSQDQYSTPSFSSKGRAGYQCKGPLLTIPSVDEDSQPGQLFEC